MKSGSKWSTVVDYFLILGSIIGVGFASGKEISVFFFQFGKASLLGLVCFAMLYFWLFFVVTYISKKLEINSYDDFNKKIFGKFCKISKYLLLANFFITSAGMLAGADYLFLRFFDIGYKIPTIILSAITLILIVGGINKIRIASNFIIPIMLFVIVTNSIVNLTEKNVHLPICEGNFSMAVYYGLLFGLNNFATALPILFSVKTKKFTKPFVVLTVCFIILLNILVLANNEFLTDMPMFELSVNASKTFYYIYFATLIMALFSTLVICSFDSKSILTKNGDKKHSVFVSFVVVLFNFILSKLGYDFIVKYLYVVSGIISAIYVLLFLIISCVILISNKLNKKQKNSNNS